MAVTARVMGVQDQQAPGILVLQLSPADAKNLNIKLSNVVTSRGSHSTSAEVMGAYTGAYYEVWLVPSTTAVTDMALAVVTIYENHFGITHTEQERAKAVERVVASLSPTVSVEALRSSSRRGR